MKLIKVSIWSFLALSSIVYILPANGNTLTGDNTLNQITISQIPVDIKDLSQPNSTVNIEPLRTNPTSNNLIQIFDPLNPTSNPNPNSNLNPNSNSNPNSNLNPNPNPINKIPEQPINQKPLTGRTIPATSAIVVTTPSDLQLDAGGTTSITLILSRAIYDGNGEEVAPVNSLVSARLQPDKGGVKIVADSLILRGKHVQIRASSAMYRGETTTIASGISKSDSFGLIGETLLRPFGDVSLVGRGLGTIVGLFSPEQQTTVRIPQGTTFILSLELTLTLQ